MDLENYITRQKEIINNVKKELEELKMSKAFDKKIIQEKLKANMNIINEIKSNIPKLLKSHEIIKQNEKENDEEDINEDDEKEELISVIFNSIDENILYSIICNKNDEFSNIESLVFDKYPEYKYLNKDFIVNGNKINKQKNLEWVMFWSCNTFDSCCRIFGSEL